MDPAPIAALVRSTRDKLLPHWGNPPDVKPKGEGGFNIVTALDYEIETYLKEELAKIAPDVEFAGEEFGGTRTAERFWLCDPIDGTGHFVRGLPYCTVMLALIEKQEVTMSFIYDFVRDELFHAVKGGGAFKNGEPIRVSDRSLSEAYLGWETHVDKPGNLEKFMGLRERAYLFKTLCAGHEFTLIASGKLEGRVHFDPHGRDWDFAPGSLLVSEAGGKIANLGKSTYDYRNTSFIAANPRVFVALTEGESALFPIHD